MKIAEKIDELLKKRKLSRRAFAKLINVPPSTFQSAMEKGQFSLPIAHKISEALSIPISEIAGDAVFFDELIGKLEDAVTIMRYEELLKRTENQETSDSGLNIVMKFKTESLDEKMRVERVNRAFSTLNEKGQQKAVEQIEDLAKIPDYQEK